MGVRKLFPTFETNEDGEDELKHVEVEHLTDFPGKGYSSRILLDQKTALERTATKGRFYTKAVK